MHKSDLYHRLPTLPTADLEQLQRLYNRDTPPDDRRGYVNKIYYRVSILLDERKDNHETHTRTLAR